MYQGPSEVGVVWILLVSSLLTEYRYCEIVELQVCRPYQANIISAVRSFMAHKPHDEAEDSQDVLAELMEAVRSAVGLNYAIAIDPNAQVVDLIFAIAHNGPTSMHLASLVHDLFQDIAEELYESFVLLCEKMLPFLSVALDVGPDGKDHPLMNVSVLFNPCIFFLPVDPLFKLSIFFLFSLRPIF